MEKIGLVSLGCPKNLVDSEQVIALLKEKGYNFVSQRELNKADIIIVNTCSFIKAAKKESINTILELGQYKKTGRCRNLIVSGCLVQQYKEKLIKQLPEVDSFVGIGGVFKILEIIQKKSQKKLYADLPNVSHEHKIPRYVSTPSYLAYVKISEGCNNLCSYCVIPSLRGRYVSRPMNSIIEEVIFLSEKGVKEINLIAQDTTFYGKDLYSEFKLAELLKELVKIEKIKWIRILYAYPSHVNDDLIDVIAKYEKICKYIDLPLQHINDKILKLMNRHYKKADIIKLILKLRSKIPNISLRTTFIVGFPQETDAEFNELLDFIGDVKFERLGSFIYSREEETKSFSLNGHIPEGLKKRRQKRLMGLQQKIMYKKNKEDIGQIKDAIIEGKCKSKKNYLKARLGADAFQIDRSIYIYSKEAKKNGDFVKVKITDSDIYDLKGVCVRNSAIVN